MFEWDAKPQFSPGRLDLNVNNDEYHTIIMAFSFISVCILLIIYPTIIHLDVTLISQEFDINFTQGCHMDLPAHTPSYHH